jgi:WD40 repeat protein
MNNSRPPVSSADSRSWERRILARFPFEMEAVCHRTGGTARAQPGKVCNISAHGLGLRLARRFEAGTELSLDLNDTPKSVAGTLHVRVMNVRETEPGCWLHGCAFVSHGAGADMEAAFRAKLGRPPGKERRGLLRYPFVVPATARPVTAALTQSWTGTTHDISAGGLRVAARSPIYAGTLLTVKLQAAAEGGARTLMARVMHASAVAAGSWDLGCMFPTRLSPDELHLLLKEGWSRNRGKKAPPDAIATLKLALADQIERNHLADARRTVAELLRLRPNDPDGVAARDFLDDTLPPTLPTAEVRCLKGHKTSVNAAAFYANGRFAISGGGVDDDLQRDTDHSIRFWDLSAGFEVHCFSGHRSPICGIAVAQRGTRALTASRCGMLLLWDVERRTVIRQLEMHGRGTNGVAISAGGKWALGGSDDALLRLWDADRGLCLRRFKGHDGPVTACAFLGDDHTGVTASMDRTVRIWTLDATQRQNTLQGHTKGVLCLAVATDNKHIISGSADNTVRIWNVASFAEVQRLEGHENVVNAVAISPDGSRIASASADNTVRIWDANKGIQIGCLSGHTQSVKCVGFSPDGRLLISAGSDQTVRLWDVAAEPQ